MTYWPGTKIVKSENNAFTQWKKDEPSIILRNKKNHISLINTQNIQKLMPKIKSLHIGNPK